MLLESSPLSLAPEVSQSLSLWTSLSPCYPYPGTESEPKWFHLWNSSCHSWFRSSSLDLKWQLLHWVSLHPYSLYTLFLVDLPEELLWPYFLLTQKCPEIWRIKSNPFNPLQFAITLLPFLLSIHPLNRYRASFRRQVLFHTFLNLYTSASSQASHIWAKLDHSPFSIYTHNSQYSVPLLTNFLCLKWPFSLHHLLPILQGPAEKLPLQHSHIWPLQPELSSVPLVPYGLCLYGHSTLPARHFNSLCTFYLSYKTKSPRVGSLSW